jgi:hypothetical protein
LLNLSVSLTWTVRIVLMDDYERVPVIPQITSTCATWWRSFCNFRFKWFIPSCNYT